MNSLLFESLQGYKPEYREIFRIVSGSHMYGLSLPTSDIDYRGVFMTNLKSSFFHRVEQVSDKKSDTVFYELHRFVDLLANCNPNLIEILFCPKDKIEFVAPEFQILLDNRHMFVSQKAYHSFSGYAYGQLKKCKGQNKMFHLAEKFGNKVEKPKLIDYCYFINDNGKPVPAGSGEVPNLQYCKAARVEHSHNWYRIYADLSKGTIIDPNNKVDGVIIDEQIACKSVSINEEKNFCGLILVNYDAFEEDKKNHAQYWEWYRNRNEDRWKDQLNKTIEYDCKNVAHCIRLLMSCQNILRNGEPRVVFDGPDRDTVMEIRNGTQKYEDILKLADGLMKQIDEDLKSTKIPYSIDREKVENMLFDIYFKHWSK